tara:strand:+ start:181 stop:1440 length:1260 start_codon:yes stop_codon:yes gene_type:complete
MVEPRIRKKPDNPNRTSRQFTSPQDMNIVPAEGPSAFQRGVNMITDVFKDTGSNIGAYLDASEKSRDGRLFAMPNAYDADLAKFPVNQAAGAGELFLDIFQLPGEALMQSLGYDQFGSGQGAGDTGYFFKNLLDIGDQRDLTDMYVNQALQASPLSMEYDELVGSDPFKNYLRGQGFNIGEDFDFMRDVINTGDEDRMNQFFQMSQDRDSPYFVDINKFSAAEGMAPYEDALQDMFDQYNVDEANKFMSGMYDDFADAQLPFLVSDLAENLGVTDRTAEGILMGTGDVDFGLLNDFMDYYKGPFEYSTSEGQALFGDDTIMNLAGGVAAIGKTSKLLKNMKNKLGTGKTAAVLEQLYPGTFGGGLNFPYRFGKDGARLNFGILHNYPTISKLIRSPAQTAGVVVAPGVTEDVVDFFSGE